MFLSTVIIAYLIYYFIFNIYEVQVKTIPSNGKVEPNSKVEIYAEPVNSLGFKAPFRKSKSDFEIIEGKNLITDLEINVEEGKLVFFTKDMEGVVEIKIRSKHGFLPSLITIRIEKARA